MRKSFLFFQLELYGCFTFQWIWIQEDDIRAENVHHNGIYHTLKLLYLPPSCQALCSTLFQSHMKWKSCDWLHFNQFARWATTHQWHLRVEKCCQSSFLIKYHQFPLKAGLLLKTHFLSLKPSAIFIVWFLTYSWWLCSPSPGYNVSS